MVQHFGMQNVLLALQPRPPRHFLDLQKWSSGNRSNSTGVGGSCEGTIGSWCGPYHEQELHPPKVCTALYFASMRVVSYSVSRRGPSMDKFDSTCHGDMISAPFKCLKQTRRKDLLMTEYMKQMLSFPFRQERVC